MAEIEIDNFDELQEEVQETQEQEVQEQETQEVEEAQEQEVQEAEVAQEQVSNKEKLMRSLVSDDDEVDELTAANIRQMLDAAPRWFLSQWKMLLLVLAGIFLYITNGYQAQVEMMKENELEAELKDWRYRSITRVS